MHNKRKNVALITGASGQDGYYLTERLLRDGWDIYALTRRPAELRSLEVTSLYTGSLNIVPIDMLDSAAVIDLITRVQAQEIYNLAGISSVAASFADPRLAWSTNLDAVVTLLDAVRLHSPHSRVYQASSSEMFGFEPNESVVHDEHSPLRPASPYAAAKAAAHLLCQSYRESFDIRIACGILFNHESSRRPEGFLTRKIVDHARKLLNKSTSESIAIPALELGNLKVMRDWGHAPDYVDGIVRIMRQIVIRSSLHANEPDIASSYRDYVLGTGEAHAVWELVDRAFALVGHDLVWNLAGADPRTWTAHFASNGHLAVRVNPEFLRPNDPQAIEADPQAAFRDLDWLPVKGLDTLLKDMLFSDQEGSRNSHDG